MSNSDESNPSLNATRVTVKTVCESCRNRIALSSMLRESIEIVALALSDFAAIKRDWAWHFDQSASKIASAYKQKATFCRKLSVVSRDFFICPRDKAPMRRGKEVYIYSATHPIRVLRAISQWQLGIIFFAKLARTTPLRRAPSMRVFVIRLIAFAAFGIASLGAIDASALTLTGVTSRKVHGAAGTFDLTIDTLQALGGLVTVEPRAIGTGHVIVFQFDDTITATGPASSADGFGPIGIVSAPVITGASNTPPFNEVSVTITGIPDNKRISFSLTQVNGILDVGPISIGFLVGDINNTRTANSSDISAVKARSGQSTAAASFIFDVNASGAINSSDISAVKARSGLTLSSATDVSLILSKTGAGGGGVSSTPVGINCGTSCTANFAQSTSVTLLATPNIASTFSSWSGGCAGATQSLVVAMTTSLSCAASFAPIPMTAGITWDPVISANLSGYRIYYGTSPGTYVQPAGQGLNVGNVNAYAWTGLTSGTLYYFAIRAYDAAGVESNYSNEVSKVVP